MALLILLALVLVPALGVLALPFLVKHQLNQWLAGQGVPSAVSGAKVNLLTSQVALESVLVGQELAPALTVAELKADIDRLALLDGELRVSALAVQGVRVDWKALAELLEGLNASGQSDGAESWSTVGLLPGDGLALHDVDLSALSAQIGQTVRLDTLSVRPVSLDQSTPVAPAKPTDGAPAVSEAQAAESEPGVAMPSAEPKAGPPASAQGLFALTLEGSIGEGRFHFLGTVDLTAVSTQVAAAGDETESAGAAAAASDSSSAGGASPRLTLNGRFDLRDVSIAGFDSLVQGGLDRALEVQSPIGTAQGSGLLEAHVNLDTGGARIAIEGRVSVASVNSAPASMTLTDSDADFDGRVVAERDSADELFGVTASGRIGLDKWAMDVRAADRMLAVAVTDGVFEGQWRTDRGDASPSQVLSGRLDANAVDVTVRPDGSSAQGGHADSVRVVLDNLRGEVVSPAPRKSDTGPDTQQRTEAAQYLFPWLRAGALKIIGAAPSPFVLEGVEVQALAGSQASLAASTVAAARVAFEGAASGAAVKQGVDSASSAPAQPLAGSANEAWVREPQLSWGATGAARSGLSLEVAAGGASLLRVDAVGQEIYLNEPQMQFVRWRAGGSRDESGFEIAGLKTHRLAVRGGMRGPGAELAFEQAAFKQVAWRRDGRLTAGELSMELAERSGEADGNWSLNGLNASTLAMGPGLDLELERITLDKWRLRAGGVTASGEGAELDAASVGESKGAAEALRLSSLALNLPGRTRVSAARLNLTRPSFGETKGYELAAASASEVKVSAAGEGAVTFSAPKLTSVVGDLGMPEGRGVLEMARFSTRRMVAEPTATQRYSFESVDLGELELEGGRLLSSSATFAALSWLDGGDTGQVDGVRLSDVSLGGPLDADAATAAFANVKAGTTDGETWRGGAMRASGFGWRGDRLLASSVDLASLSFRDAGGQGSAVSFELTDLDGEAFEWDLSDLPEAARLSAVRLNGEVGDRGRFRAGPILFEGAKRLEGDDLSVRTLSADALSVEDDRVSSRLRATRLLASDVVFDGIDGVSAANVSLASPSGEPFRRCLAPPREQRHRSRWAPGPFRTAHGNGHGHGERPGSDSGDRCSGQLAMAQAARCGSFYREHGRIQTRASVQDRPAGYRRREPHSHLR